MTTPLETQVTVTIGWCEVLEAVEEITTKAGAEFFAEHDARKLDEAAARIRTKLKDAKYEEAK